MGNTQARQKLNRPARPAAREEPRRSDAWRQALIVTVAATLVRLVIGALTPLFPDETYYWEWSRRLAPGYFDHPPMIALLIRAGTAIAGDTGLGVRLFPVIAGLVAGVFLILATRRLAGDRGALIASLIFALMPLSAAGLILATPDAPLFAAASGCVYCVIRATEASDNRSALLWWAWSGAALGVAMTSKYTAVLLALGVFLAVLSSRELRMHLASPGPYVAVFIALLLFAPVVVWNAQHDWASFAFQLRHGLGGVGGSVIGRELEMLGGQLGLVTPILFVMMILAAARAASASRVLLAIAATTVFGFFVYSATQRRVEANWPALAYVPGIVLLAAHMAGTAWHRWLRAGVALAALLTIVTYVNTFTPILPVPARRDPVARSHGWHTLAAAVHRIHGPRLSISSYRTWVAADRYQETSQLAFHLPETPEVFSLNLTTRPNQYDLWPTFVDRAQPRDGLVLVTDDMAGDTTPPTVQQLTPHFESVQRDSLVILARNNDPVKYLRVWVLDRWRGTWPERPLRSRP